MLLEGRPEEGYNLYGVQITASNDGKDTTLTFYKGNPKLLCLAFKKTFKSTKICSADILRTDNEEIMILAVIMKSGDEISKPSMTFSILKPDEKTLKNLFVIRALPHHRKFFKLERNQGNIRLFVLVSEGKGIFYKGASDVDFSANSEAFELIEVEEGHMMIDVAFVEDRASLNGVNVLILWEDKEKGNHFISCYRNLRSEKDEKKWVMTGKRAVVGEPGSSCQWSAFIYDEEKESVIMAGFGSRPPSDDLHRVVMQIRYNIEMRPPANTGMSPNRFELQDPAVLLRCHYMGPETPSIPSTVLPNYLSKLVRGNRLYCYQNGVVDRFEYHQDAETGASVIRLIEKEGSEEEKLKDIVGVGSFDDKTLEENYERIIDDRLPYFFLTRDLEVLLEDG